MTNKDLATLRRLARYLRILAKSAEGGRRNHLNSQALAVERAEKFCRLQTLAEEANIK